MSRRNGFSLLEILVAFAIMAVAITIVLRIFGGGVHKIATSEEYSIAVQIAESLMARVGIELPLQAGETVGEEGEKYDWAILITAVDPQPNQNQVPDATDNQGQQQAHASPLFNVKVRVVWESEGSGLRVVELHSLKSF